MPSLRNESVRNALIQRLSRLTPDVKPQWGKLDAPRMICHLDDSLAMALGVIPVKSANKKAFQHFPMKHLIIHLLPMPKSVPTAPELLFTTPNNFDADRRRVVELIERLAAMPRAMGPEHPFFGPLTNEQWNALAWKHTDHHLRQFGL
jgi:hypothetical protein